jgi:hypothetical protein
MIILILLILSVTQAMKNNMEDSLPVLVKGEGSFEMLYNLF